jgi:hypothetical protein
MTMRDFPSFRLQIDCCAAEVSELAAIVKKGNIEARPAERRKRRDQLSEIQKKVGRR